ncbi:MAG: membrane integrity-associated transporter subunit PqiC [Phycisphaerae bacterium]|nr:membrane integrity-associated transporter subunit PqiC [Phycisphaerae bacterium]
MAFNMNRKGTSMRTIALLTALTAPMLVGCMSRAYQGQALYALDGGAPGTGAATVANAQAPTAGGRAHPGVLRIREVTVSTPYSNTQFVYRYADGRMRTDPYASFIGSPENLINRALVARLSQERLFENVGGSDLSGVTAYELVVSIRTLGAVFEADEQVGTAQMSGVAYVLDPTAPAPLVLATFEIGAREALGADTADAVAAGLNEALASWMNRLSEHLRQADLPPLQGSAPTAAAAGSSTLAPRK